MTHAGGRITTEGAKPQPTLRPRPESLLQWVQWDRPSALLLALAAFAVRISALDAKGLAYDEAATALMSRSDLAGIVAFHWDAAFEHLPLWIVLMRGWSEAAGQSEFALRYTSALAGLATVTLAWALLRMVRPRDLSWRLWTATLICLSPVLILYSQEARMYALVVALGVASTLLLLLLFECPRWSIAIGFVLVNMAMLGLHYYALLLLVAEAAFIMVAPWLIRRGAAGYPIDGLRKSSLICFLAIVVSVIPLSVWLAFSPGFRETVTVVFHAASSSPVSYMAFLSDLWTDLSFGAIRWQPGFAVAGFLLLPLFVLGLVASFAVHDGRGLVLEDATSITPSISTTSKRRSGYALWPWLFALVVFVPLVVSTLLLRTLSTRYILYIAPFTFAYIAYGIVYLWRYKLGLGVLAGMVAIAVCVTGAGYYFGPYVKSEYREMARYLQAHYTPGTDAVLLEAPRQHLLAKYYLGQDFPLQPVPDVPLPEYWPVTAPLIVPEKIDDLVQELLAASSNVWLILTSEAEVDPGEIVPKYLTAVSFKDDCLDWLDVRLCRFISPRSVAEQVVTKTDADFDGGLVLELFSLSVDEDLAANGQTPLLITLFWRAQTVPAADYKVSIKLLDGDGTLVSQADEYPIGPLLLPTTWNAGDVKPGYIVLPIPESLPDGAYTITVELYDPATMVPVAFSQNAAPAGQTLELGHLEIGDTIRLLPSSNGEAEEIAGSAG